MLKQIVQYDDYDDVPQVETLYFNITKVEAMEIQYLVPVLEKFAKIASEEPRDLTTEETTEFLGMFKELIRVAYGIREDDGKRFAKSEGIYKAFAQSAAYDAFVFNMFEQPEKAVAFMTGIMPKGVVPIENLPAPPTEGNKELDATVKEVPAYIRENRDPTPVEFSKMTQAEMMDAYQRKQNRTSE